MAYGTFGSINKVTKNKVYRRQIFLEYSAVVTSCKSLCQKYREHIRDGPPGDQMVDKKFEKGSKHCGFLFVTLVCLVGRCIKMLSVSFIDLEVVLVKAYSKNLFCRTNG